MEHDESRDFAATYSWRNPFWWQFGLTYWHSRVLFHLSRVSEPRLSPVAGKGLSRDMYLVAFLAASWNPMHTPGARSHMQ